MNQIYQDTVKVPLLHSEFTKFRQIGYAKCDTKAVHI